MYQIVACHAACYRYKATVKVHAVGQMVLSIIGKVQAGCRGANHQNVAGGKILTCIDGLAASLQQQQLVKGLEDVNGGLVDGTHYGPASVNNVAHCPHHNGSRPCIQPCTRKGQV